MITTPNATATPPTPPRHSANWTAPAFVEAVTSGKVGVHGIEEAISR